MIPTFYFRYSSAAKSLEQLFLPYLFYDRGEDYNPSFSPSEVGPMSFPGEGEWWEARVLAFQ